MTLVSLARAANATIASKPASTAVPRKNDALRSLRTPGTESPRRVTPAQRPTDETYNLFGRFGVGTPRWHSSPRESELRNSHLGWIRFRGPVSPFGLSLSPWPRRSTDTTRCLALKWSCCGLKQDRLQVQPCMNTKAGSPVPSSTYASLSPSRCKTARSRPSGASLDHVAAPLTALH